jgi:hypothetical protein
MYLKLELQGMAKNHSCLQLQLCGTIFQTISELKTSHKHTYKAHTVSKCNIKSTKIKDILKHAEAISSKHKITKQH